MKLNLYEDMIKVSISFAQPGPEPVSENILVRNQDVEGPRFDLQNFIQMALHVARPSMLHTSKPILIPVAQEINFTSKLQQQQD